MNEKQKREKEIRMKEEGKSTNLWGQMAQYP
jgi:hypothetical protein